MKNHAQYDVIVIGGGASGMMAAGCAAERGRNVLLLEKNKFLGEKLKITGGGRCNITNAEDKQKLLSNYGSAKVFLHSPFSQFGIKDTFSFFESRGLPLVVQAHNRVFPKTEKALDVFFVLNKYLIESRVKVLTNSGVDRFVFKDGEIKSVFVKGKEFSADSFILSVGGKSHPETGSTGDGFSWLSDMGHTIKEPTPTIVPLAVKDAWVKKLSGTTLKGVRITFYLNTKRKFVLKGDVLCTHFGLSGPLILNSAGKVADLLHEGEVTAVIDLYPQEDLRALDKRVTGVFDQNKNKVFKNVFSQLSPSSVLSLLNINLDVKVHSITKEQRKDMVNLLKALPVTITGLMGYDRAVVADGGVALSEINTKTMGSRLFHNLYITGDLLHISRPSGGYSLQLCWTTGFVAGKCA